MSRIISNLILSAAMAPLIFSVAAITAWAVEEHQPLGLANYQVVTVVSAVVTLGFVYLYWFAVWRSMVRWTRRRGLRTLLAVAGSLGAGLVLAMTSVAAKPNSFDGAVVFGAFVAGLGWVILSTLVWRETTAEKAERLHCAAGGGGGYIGPLLCPMCGYDMRGLYHARCPECGVEYTLDALLTANVASPEPERERATGD